MNLFIYISVFFFFIGIYMITCEALKLPTLRTSKMVITLYSFKKVNRIDTALDDLSSFISQYITINKYKKEKLKATLKSAGINQSPEKYVVSTWVKALLPLVFLLPLCIFSPIILPIALVFCVRTYFEKSKTAEKKLMKEKEKIEYELPRFTRGITQELKSSRDILGILERYKRTAGESLKRELDITIADMRSGNWETALTRFETRLQSPMVSDVVRGLISVIRGDDASIYFQMLAHDFKSLEIQRLKNEAAKRPGKIKKYSFLMLGCMLCLYMVIIVFAIMQSAKGML